MNTNFEARELKLDDFIEWDKLVMESPQGTPFHTTNWLKICSEIWRGGTRFWGCFQNKELVGGCALRVLNLGLLKRAANSSMMTPYNGIILKPMIGAKLKRVEIFHKNVIDSLCFLLEKLNFVKLVNSPSLSDIRPFILRGWVPKVTYTYILNLSNITMEHFTKDMRYEIRKALKYNIVIERSNDGSRYFELYKSMLLRKNATPPAAELKMFFQHIVELLYQKNLGELWFAKNTSDEILAGEILVFDTKRAYRWSAASNGKYQHTGATSLLLYEIIKDIQNRFIELDMGGADFFELHHHSAEFNPTLIPSYTIEKSNVATQILYSAVQKVNNSLNSLLKL